MLPRKPGAVNARRRRPSSEPILRAPGPRGLPLEHDLEVFHRTLPGWYVTRNLADRSKGKRGEPDYTGIPSVYGAGFSCEMGDASRLVRGRPVVMFDAKSTRDARWPISLLAQHQAVAFSRITALGHQAGVYLRLGTGPDAGDWWLPWADLAEGWNAWWTKRETFYPTPTRRIVAMDWTRAVGT
jgi:hypothetical protein